MNWKPRRYGADNRFYCSPACGRNCTYEEYVTASAAALRLAKELGGRWQPRIFENLGWHYEAILVGPDGKQLGTATEDLPTVYTPKAKPHYRIESDNIVGKSAESMDAARAAFIRKVQVEIENLQAIIRACGR